MVTIELLGAGFIAGLVGAFAMKIIVALLRKAGVEAKLNIPLRLGTAFYNMLGQHPSEKKIVKAGGALHIFTGSVLGLLFVLGASFGWWNTAVKASTLFSLLPWAVMQLVVLPAMGAGAFGLKVDKKVPVMTLVLHLIYGVVLGLALPYFVSY